MATFCYFSQYFSLLVPPSYRDPIGDVPYIFHICSIYDPYIFQYYKDMEYIWNTIGSWIYYLWIFSVMVLTSWGVSEERNAFRVPCSVFRVPCLKGLKFEVWSLKGLRLKMCTAFNVQLLTTRSLVPAFLAVVSGSIKAQLTTLLLLLHSVIV